MDAGTLAALITGPAGMAVVAWYLLTKTLPGFRMELAAFRMTLANELSKVRDDLGRIRESHFESSRGEAAALAAVENRLARIEAVLVADSGGRIALETGVGLVRKRKRKRPPD